MFEEEVLVGEGLQKVRGMKYSHRFALESS